jgi:hypothetical protein
LKDILSEAIEEITSKKKKNTRVRDDKALDSEDNE